MAKNGKKKGASNQVPDGPRFTMKLPVKLSEREIASREHRVVEALTEIGEKKKELLEETAPIRDAIKALHAEVELCRKQSTEGSEEREVPCVVNKDYKAGEKWTIRIDTRAEVPDTRKPLTPEERQEVFPTVGKGKRGGGLRSVPNADEEEAPAPADDVDESSTEVGG